MSIASSLLVKLRSRPPQHKKWYVELFLSGSVSDLSLGYWDCDPMRSGLGLGELY